MIEDSASDFMIVDNGIPINDPVNCRIWVNIDGIPFGAIFFDMLFIAEVNPNVSGPVGNLPAIKSNIIATINMRKIQKIIELIDRNVAIALK